MYRMNLTLWNPHEETQCLLPPETPFLPLQDFPPHLLEVMQLVR